MKQFWSNSKEDLVAAEEGKANLVPVPKNGCRKFTQIVQSILVIEIALFLGWAFFSFYQSQYVSPTDLKEDQLRKSALKKNFQLNPDSPNDLDFITWQEKSSQNKAFDPPSSSEPWSAKTQNVLIPESFTETDSVLLNEDSVFHSQQSSPYVTIPSEIKESTEYVTETTPVPTHIANLKNQENLNEFESEIGMSIVTEAPRKMVEDIAETSSEIPQMSTLVAEMDGNSSAVEKFQKELEKEIQKVLDKSQKDEDFSPLNLIQILHDLDRAKATAAESVPAEEIVPSYVKKYHFQFSMGPETGIQESVDNEKSQEVSQQIPFFIHVFFNVSDSDVSSAENADSFLQGKQSVSDPGSFFADSGFSRQPTIEDSSLDDESLKWWVNIPEFQQTKVGSFSDEESQRESMILTSAPKNEESGEQSLFNLFFNQSDSPSVIPESNEHEYKSNEVLEAQPESSDTLLTAAVSQILPDEVDLVDQHMKKIDEQSSVEPNHGYVKEAIPEEALVNEAELEKQINDFMKALENIKISNEDRVINGIHTESNLNQEESMKVEEETVSEENQEIPETDISWKDEQKRFHSQPTWKEETDGDLNEWFKNLEAENYEYEESSKFDSRDYMYND
ncbi:uncharacterized protein LOC117174217 [Belonocnema kinseyi]|uniref:uncharacterized protein LOC117174217 n=1 Tax=Belonocnema kinseyi TaxID=2817044 RepID=UPI00143DCD36|nr:uncharacterized protein LOC117174217 [Belonocnema kinseyi]